MHTSGFGSFSVHHDGDGLKGPMYLNNGIGDEIVITVASLTKALLAYDGNGDVRITAPDADIHDRHETTKNSGCEDIDEGEWKTKTISVPVADLKTFLLYAKLGTVETLLEEFKNAAVFNIERIEEGNESSVSFEDTLDIFDNVAAELRKRIGEIGK